MAKKTNTEEYIEELSDKTLELMLFHEIITNKDFISRLSEVVDYRWFRTPYIRIMAEIAVNTYKKLGGLMTKDLMESILQRKNDKQKIEANQIDLNTAMFEFNKAKDLDLGSMMDESMKIAKIQTYVKQEALRNALLDSASDLEQVRTDNIIGGCLKKFEDIQKILFEKVDFGYEFASDTIDMTLNEHMEYLTNPSAKLSTGWNCLDDLTRGGFLRDGKSIYVFMAQAGLGKSNILSNLGYNFLKQGMKVLVVSMEMSQDVYMRRFDALISKIDIDDLGISAMSERLLERLDEFFKKQNPTARLFIKEFPPKSISSRNIDQYIEKLVEQKGFKPDVILLDYLNLVKPNNTTRGETNMYEDGKMVSEELRALSYKYEIPIITAVQCNSSGFNTADIGMENISESRGIAHTADFIAGLYQTEDEQVDGTFHMKVLKNRFGDKRTLTFQFNKDTMEFTDINDDIPQDANQSVVDSTKSNAATTNPTMVDIEDDIFGPNGGFNSDLGMP